MVALVDGENKYMKLTSCCVCSIFSVKKTNMGDRELCIRTVIVQKHLRFRLVSQ